MSEQTHIQTGTENDTDSYRQPVNASFELFPDTELDLAEEIQRINPGQKPMNASRQR